MSPKSKSMKDVYNILYAPDEDDADDSDLDRLAKTLGLERRAPYKANPGNPLYVGQIGRYEVWEGRTGYAVWEGDTCHALDFRSSREAASAAHKLHTDDAAECARYLAIRYAPANNGRRNVKKNIAR